MSPRYYGTIVANIMEMDAENIPDYMRYVKIQDCSLTNDAIHLAKAAENIRSHRMLGTPNIQLELKDGEYFLYDGSGGFIASFLKMEHVQMFISLCLK